MKILIVGSVASGKTTFAKNLSKKLSIKYYEIDSIVHDDLKNTKRSNEEQVKKINDINENDDWIIEGTLRKNLYFLLDLADRIIYLNVPLNFRKRRILSRYIKQKIGIEKSNYKPNIKILKSMYKWTKEFELEKEVFENHLKKYTIKLIVLIETKNLDYNVMFLN